jgi:hypothetical protein
MGLVTELALREDRPDILIKLRVLFAFHNEKVRSYALAFHGNIRCRDNVKYHRR